LVAVFFFAPLLSSFVVVTHIYLSFDPVTLTSRWSESGGAFGFEIVGFHIHGFGCSPPDSLSFSLGCLRLFHFDTASL
jgi:hypothetical protein